MAAKVSKDSSIVIVGGGTWACSTALHLVRRGYSNVTVLDAHPIPSSISAGNDVNKIAELASPTDGDDAESVAQAAAAAAAQGWLHDPVFAPYYHDTGFIVSGSSPEALKHIVDSELRGHEKEYTKLNSADDFRACMPNGVLTGDFPNWQGWHKSKGAGWVHARKALVSAYKEAERLGARFITGSPQGEVIGLVQEGGDVRGAKTADGYEHRADRTILAVGASAPQFVDFENQLRPTAWTLGHIKMTEEEAQLYKNLPVLFNVEKGFFMEPDEDRHELKICDEHPGYCNWVTLPDSKLPESVPFAKHQVPIESEQRIKQFLSEIMPHLADRPLVHARICWCADTHDRGFLITYHPSHPSLVIAAGDSGHGFAHIPSIGGFISDCLEGRLEGRFARHWRWRPEIAQGFWGKDPLDSAVLLATSILRPVAAKEQPLDGIKGLADRLLSGQGDAFEFELTEQHDNWSRWNHPSNDNYTVSAGHDGKIHVQGTTLSALARGLRHYATETLHLDEFWFVDSNRKLSAPLPQPKATLTGASIVPWRYNFNTVTFSYTFAWYKWEDWEKLLDWAAWRGVNLQLAWVGYEKIFLDSFRDLGMKDDEILPFFSGPAFQAWNRFGNTKGSWGGVGDLPLAWIESQFDMQKKIVARMVELGMVPVLPAFPGFVPDAIKRVRPNANVTKAPNWSGVGQWSEDLFLSPLDDTYAELQHLFVTKQIEAFGNVTNIYTLDQFNEMMPASGDTEYLKSAAEQTYKGLTAANPAAIWLMQGWLFYNAASFWTQERIDAYLGGVKDDNSMIILDLYSENNPQWQRTKSYSGKPWIWCELHDFGGNMNLFGQITNITVTPIEALGASDSLVGFGLTPEAFEGNEVVYDLLLDQAWSPKAIDTKAYFHDWVSSRYGGVSSIPCSLYQAWEIMRRHVYDSKDPLIPSAGAGIYQLAPSLTGLVNRTGHFPAPTALQYDPRVLRQALTLMLKASAQKLSLWEMPAFQLDLVDVTRQVMSNAFIDVYQDLVKTYNSTMQGAPRSRSNRPSDPSRAVAAKGQKLLLFIEAIDAVLATNEHFTLEKWLDDAQYWAKKSGNDKLLSFNARSQVTVWLWESSGLNDYSARAWSGVTRDYYKTRWAIFVDCLKNATKTGSLDEGALHDKIRAFEKEWSYGGFGLSKPKVAKGGLKDTISKIKGEWPDVFEV
ncbi:alpha-N-acetylglucosaminidase [Purpureocillium lilacinum]|uniref:Alpha-N-acetylglucosaminidase n=1 Tax=Purpureocillium lilacinum TaxID=33203 RepID=A0A179HPE8_PURLI|nr:alpha-N-acetylglucosaminidase [Purpureocillium lilacinum]OAQ91320.1 alpha-N-acetylglucosaminidase [Purpureocillium lilacinum]